MKKIIALLLVTVMTISLPVFVWAEEAVSYTETAMVADFDFESDAASGAGISDRGEYDFGGDYGKVMIPPSTAVAETDIATGLNDYKGTLKIEADYYLGSLANDFTMIYTRDGSARSAVTLASGKITLFGTANSATVNEDGWNHIIASLDYVTGKASLDVNGTLLSDVAMPDGHTYTSLVRMYVKDQYATEETPVYIDNVKVTYNAKNYVMSLDPVNADGESVGTDSAEYAGGKIKVNFSEKMNPEFMVKENFSVKDSYGEDVGFSALFDATENVFIITPASDLAPKTAYTVTAKNLRTDIGGKAHSSSGVTFTTKNRPFSISAVSAESEGVYTVSVQNTTGSEQTGLVVGVSYTGNRMSAVGLAPVSGTESDDYTVTLTNLGDRVDFYLMAYDGSFEILDIWGR